MSKFIRRFNVRAGNGEHSQDIFCLDVCGQPRSPRTQGHMRPLERRAVPSPWRGPLISACQSEITNNTGIMRLATAYILSDLLSQIWQPSICPVASNQILFSVLTGPSAFFAG